MEIQAVPITTDDVAKNADFQKEYLEGVAYVLVKNGYRKFAEHVLGDGFISKMLFTR